MKKLLLLFVVPLLLTSLLACSGEVDGLDGGGTDASGKTEVSVPTPLAFDAYVDRATSRAGSTGELTTSTSTGGKVSLQTQGFGVFAYYTDDKLYTPAYLPNFMYNTKVSGSNWSYSPVRYWPNETGTSSGGAGVDRLSLFAYAPWVEVTPATGIPTASTDTETGIVGLTRNGATGDPMVRYNATFMPAKRVDLCWGVANANYTSSADATLKNNIAAGSPYLNMLKPATGNNNKISFNFKHALAALNVQIDADVDATHKDTGAQERDGNTRIYIRSITFEGFAMKGALNLNASASTGPRWFNPSFSGGVSTAPVTLHDGRTDGREAVGVAVNETPVGLNPVLVQSEPYLKADYTSNSTAVKTGVTKTMTNLFDVTGLSSGDTPLTAPVYLIPNGTPLKVRIVYDVETQSSKLPGYLADGRTKGSSIENDISKTIDVTMVAGNLYTLKIHLGMTSVKIDEPAVSAWPTTGTEAPAPNIKAAAPEPIGFTATMADMEDATTRATGAVSDNTTLNTQGGFGVFAAYTGLHKYSDSNVTSDFLYNQQVKLNGSAWSYEPVVYWPNGEGDAGTPTGANPHYVSFFAYAPYSDTDTSNSNSTPADYCISGFSYAHEQTDPWLTYRLHTDVTKQVDLLYATPLLDQTKPATGGKLKFSFKHALGCVGDKVTVKAGKAMTLKKVTVTYRLTDKGRLILNSSGQPNWKPIMSENFLTERTLTLLSSDKTLAANGTWSISEKGVFYIPIETGGREQTATVEVTYQVGSTVKTGSTVLYLKDFTDAYQAGKHLYINVTVTE